MPVELKVGNKQRCVNTGILCVTPSCRIPLVVGKLYLNSRLPQDFQKSLLTDAIQGVDIYYQLSRLRHGKNLPDAEVELMMRTFAENLQNYDQVVEVG